MTTIPDSLITLPGRIARLCQNQRLLTKLTNQIGEAITKDDWLAVEGLSDQVVVAGNDLGLDAYMVSKVAK